MIKEKAKEEERALSVEYKAREIPKAVKGNKFQQMEEMKRKRSEDNRKFARLLSDHSASLRETRRLEKPLKRELSCQQTSLNLLHSELIRSLGRCLYHSTRLSSTKMMRETRESNVTLK